MKGQLNAFPGIAKENFFGGTGAWAQGFSSLLDRWLHHLRNKGNSIMGNLGLKNVEVQAAASYHSLGV
jgi:hypothetical protein